jgi:hypothetical protein
MGTSPASVVSSRLKLAITRAISPETRSARMRLPWMRTPCAARSWIERSPTCNDRVPRSVTMMSMGNAGMAMTSGFGDESLPLALR